MKCSKAQILESVREPQLMNFVLIHFVGCKKFSVLHISSFCRLYKEAEEGEKADEISDPPKAEGEKMEEMKEMKEEDEGEDEAEHLTRREVR